MIKEISKNGLTIKAAGIIDYYRERINKRGWKEVTGISDTGYPRFLATGIAYYKENEVLVIKYPKCLSGMYRKLIYHEVGHLAGLKHVNDKNKVMYPNFKRGEEGIKSIRDYFKQDDIDIEHMITETLR